MILRPAFIFPISDITPTNIQFTEQDMGDATISCSVSIPADVDPQFGNDGSWSAYIGGESYILKTYLPSGTKDDSSLKYKYDLLFISEREQLKYRLFATFDQLADGSLQVFSYTIPFQADIAQFADRIGQNLKFSFGSRWRVDINPEIISNTTTALVQANNASIWAVLTQMYDLYGVRWSISEYAGQMVIRIGYPSVEVEHIFEYGIDDGLVFIQRTNPNDDIYTRLYGRGGTRNVPHNYFKSENINFPADPDYNENLRTGFFPNILPISTRRYIQGWNDAERGLPPSPTGRPKDAVFYNMGYDDKLAGRNMQLPNYAQSDLEIIDKHGLREGVLEDNEQIFPTIQNIWSPTIGKIDEIVAVEQVESDNQTGTVQNIDFDTDSVAVKHTFTAAERSNMSSASTNGFLIADTSKNILFTLSFEQMGMNEGAAALSGSVTVYIVEANTTIIVGYKQIDIHEIIDGTRTSDIFEDIAPGLYYLSLGSSLTYSGYVPAWCSIDMGGIQIITPSAYKETFDVWIKDIWQETGTIKSIWDPKISTSELTVMFSTGNLAGEDREFIVAKGPEGNSELPDPGGNWYIWEDESKSIETLMQDGSIKTVSSKWRLSLIKSDVELNASGKMLPNTMINAKPKDNFFFINIELPQKYVEWAEEREQDYLEAELAKKDEEYPTFAIKPSPIFCADFNESDKIRAGAKMRIRDQQLLGDSYTPIFINTLTLRWPDDKILPTWDVVISDKLIGNNSPIALLQGQINRLAYGNTGMSSTDTDTIRAMERIFLRKDGISDRSYSPTTFMRETTHYSKVTSNDFRQGDFGGTGWGLYRDSTGASVAEVDKLVVRRQMRVNEVLVNQIMFTGGKQVFSAAGGTIERVEEEDSYYRCYIDTKMASLMNHFQIGDQAYHQDFDPISSTINRYYWRLVVGVGSDYIDLSKTDADGSSAPQAEDNIAQLGNRTNTDRQSALIIDMVRDGGGLVTWYDGISSFSLSEKDSVNIGRIDGETWVQAYGNAYFGRRDESRYFRVRDGFAELKGVLAVSMADDGVTDFIIVYRGEYSDTTEYAQGDKVLDPNTGNYYVYINPVAGAGHPVTSSEYWRLESSSAEAESMYTWVKYSDYKNPTDDQIFDTPTETPSGNASWIGQAFNKQTPTESTVASDYVWLPFLNTDGRDGNSQEFIFKRTNNSAVPTPAVEQIPAQQQDGWYPGQAPYNYGWTPDPTGVNSTYQWEWVSTRRKINGTWTQFSPAALWSKWGENGPGAEYRYLRTTTSSIPSPPPTGDWTDTPRGVTSTYKWEWISQRTISTSGTWSGWSYPALFAKYSESGGGVVTAYCRRLESDGTPTIPTWSSGSSFADLMPLSPSYWYTSVPTTPADGIVWMSTGQGVVNDSGTWSVTNRSNPVKLTGPAGPAGRTLLYQGDWDQNKSYPANPQTAAVVRYRLNTTASWVYYYTTIRAGGLVTGNPPSGTGLNNDYWIAFQGNFDSIATDILFADQGQLGDFTFYRNDLREGIFESTEQTVLGQSNIFLNSKTGEARFKSGTIGGFRINAGSIASTGTGGFTSPGMSLMSTFMGFRSSDGTRVARIGTDVFDAVSGMPPGLLYLSSTSNSGSGEKVAVSINCTGSSTGQNAAIEIGSGYISGLRLKTVSTSLYASYTATKLDNYIIANRTSNQTINLPAPSTTPIGQLLFVRRATSAVITLQGRMVVDSTSIVTSKPIGGGFGDIAMLLNDGNVWHYNWFGR